MFQVARNNKTLDPSEIQLSDHLRTDTHQRSVPQQGTVNMCGDCSQAQLTGTWHFILLDSLFTLSCTVK
jgi:hypothetical protein